MAFARNPMSMAYTTNQLQEYSGGRVVLGMGSQVRRHIEKRFSSTWSHPAARMREYVLAPAGDLGVVERGGRSRVRGRLLHAHLDDARLRPAAARRADRPGSSWPPSGPVMNEVAGEVADGVITHGICFGVLPA